MPQGNRKSLIEPPETLILIVLVSSKGLGEPTQRTRLAKALAAFTYSIYEGLDKDIDLYSHMALYCRVSHICDELQ